MYVNFVYIRRAIWRKAFLAWDADNSGTVNRDEMRQVFRDVIGRELSEPELDKVFNRFDKNHDGSLSYTEFARALRRLVKLTDDDVELLADLFDVDGDGPWVFEPPPPPPAAAPPRWPDPTDRGPALMRPAQGQSTTTSSSTKYLKT